ncbi:MAG: hypothetical protein QOF44_4254 [Streptomyces sp.]|jgi:pimeloyl-ACP methyl ester carboxylesterase|nr:hypothetical protein [Streptomyces sp.]
MENPTAALVRTTLNATSLIAPRLAGKGVFALFRRPVIRAGLRPADRELMDEARTGRLTVSGKRVVTYRWGSGERPVLLVHGWQSRASHLAGFIAALREKGYSPVAFDAPGHGESAGQATSIFEYREAIHQLHAEYGDFEAIVGHSFGVMATFYALRGDMRARRLVAIAGAVEFDFLVEQFCAALSMRARLAAELRRRLEGVTSPGEAEPWKLWTATHRPWEIEAPLLVIHDEDDDLIPAEQAHRLAAAYGSRSRLLTTRGLGHRRILGDPEVIAAVREFVALDAPRQLSSSSSET